MSHTLMNEHLYRQAYINYRQWIKADLHDQILPVDLQRLAERWEQYLTVAELAWDSCSTPGDWQRLEKISDIDHQYACMFKFELWRFGKANPAKSPRNSTAN
jgi:hypothetical protein